MQSASIDNILHEQEIRQLIERLQQLSLADYASPLWFKQDEALQKLNMQLHVSALMKHDEFILNECIVLNKFKMLIYDLIMTTVWKQKVFPTLLPSAQKLNSLKSYLSIYHEAVVCNLLEVLMFYRTAITQSGEMLIELVGYCYGKIVWQVGQSSRRKKREREQEKQQKGWTEEQKKEYIKNQIIKRTPKQQLENQYNEIQFSLFTMSVSILRYITDYLKDLEIAIIHHLLIECNIYSVLVPLIQEKPWLREKNGVRQVWQNGKWTVVEKGNYGKLPKIQAQVWIAIYNLFMNPECRGKYQLNDQRKNTLLRLRKYLNEVILDQIPALSYLLRSLEELSMMNVPTHLSSNPFVVEQVPYISSSLLASIDLPALTSSHLARLSQSIDETQRQQIQRLADLYSHNSVQGLTDGFKCGKCTKPAFKRCTRCKERWYCSPECQKSDWSDHKAKCNARAAELKQAEEAQVKIKIEKQQQKMKQEIAEVSHPKSNLIDELD